MKSIRPIMNHLEDWAAGNGVLRIGVSPLEDAHIELFRDWIDQGHHGSMEYLRRHLSVREAPGDRYPWARSVIAISVPYHPERPVDDSLAAGMARYAQGDDYHDVLEDMLRGLEALIASLAPEERTWRYVDTGPLSDRSMAAQAGLGWIGRNGMLIDERNGSWFFIGLLVTSLEPDVITPSPADRCGTCTRCIDACPTDAILPGRQVDARRCISHSTIETRGAVAEELLGTLAGNVFGCDICQEVCPWNRKPAEGHPSLAPREEYRATPVTDLLRFDQERFSTTFRRSAVKRAKRAGMIRNAIAVAGPKLTDEELSAFERDEDTGIRSAAAFERKRRTGIA